MRLPGYRTWLPWFGILLMGGIFFTEIFTNMLFTVAFIAIAASAFWLSEGRLQLILVGILATLFMATAYILVMNEIVHINQSSLLSNRIMGVIVIWFAYYFTVRYKKSQADELRQRDEIQEGKLAEERLRSSQEMYKAIARNFPEGWIGILDKELRYVFADGKGLMRLGLTANQLIGKKFVETVNAEGVETYLRDSLNGNSVTFEIECKKGTCEVNAGPFHNGHKENRILVVVHDITTLKRTETELIKALEKEKELGELKSKFVTLASHEFRTPLTTILSSSFLLESYTGEKYEKEKATHIGRIKRSVKILTEILNDFLSLGRLEEGEIKARYERINFLDFLDELKKEVESLKRGGQRLVIRHTGDVVVESDPQLLRNIIYNLTSNAFKYTHNDDTVLIESNTVNGKLTLSVTDHGMGIPAEEQKYIFKRFYRAHNATNIQGTGLGLNIVKKYINLLNGSIEFTSMPNEGTIFRVTVPVKETSSMKKVTAL